MVKPQDVPMSIASRNGSLAALQTVDEELAQVTSSSLCIAPSEVRRCIITNFKETQQKHPGLYSSSLADYSPMGVPGFPDFPSCWDGTTAPQRTPKSGDNSRKGKTLKEKRNERKQKRIYRKAVNHIPRQWRCKPNTRAKALPLSRKRKCNQRRDMKELRLQLSKVKLTR